MYRVPGTLSEIGVSNLPSWVYLPVSYHGRRKISLSTDSDYFYSRKQRYIQRRQTQNKKLLSHTILFSFLVLASDV